MRTPLIHQAEAHECGLACLAMVYGHYRDAVTLDYLRRQFPLGQQGTRLSTLRKMASELGFCHRALRAEPRNLCELKVPAILHWDLNHFVVLVKANTRRCVVHDPAEGRLHLSWDEVGTRFSGVVLELWLDASDPKPSRDGERRLRLRDLWRVVHRDGGVGRIVALSVVLQLLVLVGPWQLQWSVDEALMTGDAHLLAVLAVGFGCLFVLRTLTHWLRGALVIRVGHAMAFHLGSRLLQHLLHIPVAWFARRHAGDVLSRFASLSPVRQLFTEGAASLVVDAMLVVLSTLAMLVYSWRLALIVLGVNAVFCGVYLALVPRMRRLSAAGVVAEASEQAHLLESARGVASIKVYGQQSRRLNDWQGLHARTLAASVALQRTQLTGGTTGLLCAGLEGVLVVYLGAHAVLDGVLTIGMLFAFMSYRGYFSERLHSAVQGIVAIRSLRVHLDRLSDIWHAETESHNDGWESHRYGAIAPIGLTEVAFRYAPDTPRLLRRTNLTVAAGEFVAFIGRSGTGKTTLLHLFMGLLDASEGEIRYGSTVLNRTTAVRLRRGMACVLQEDGLFAGSVADNLTLFEQADAARMWAVLDAVALAPTIEALPMGLLTPVGDVVSGFSSGQVQRLLLARALYGDPHYLFLDEGTANLDPASSEIVRRIVRAQRCTRVVVTHDMAFARMADRCFELEGGRLLPVSPPRTSTAPSAT